MFINNYKWECFYQDYPKERIITRLKMAPTYRKHKASIINVPNAFDIETTNIPNPMNKKGEKAGIAWMYHAQICIADTVVFFREWGEYIDFLNMLRRELNLSKSHKLVIYVHNLSFEWQFLKDLDGEWDSIFAPKRREILTAEQRGIEYRCSYKLANRSLSQWCRALGVETQKLSGYDYNKIRYSDTPMIENELMYCYADVVSLVECLKVLMREDTLASIPLTSTGYVRRDCKRRIGNDKFYYNKLSRLNLTEEQYITAVEARRGGNVHGNGLYTGVILDDVHSYDRNSSYPAVIMTKKYPMKKFLEVDEIIEDAPLLMDVTFDNLKLRKDVYNPYISVSKITERDGRVRTDNGRLLSSNGRCRMCLTDIDRKIIISQYYFDDVHYNKIYASAYDYLPEQIRETVIQYYIQKELMRGVDAVEYEKMKNLLNAIFGMMLTDYALQRALYDGVSWRYDDKPLSDRLKSAYGNNGNFLAYQWGLWVTAWARMELEEGIKIVGRDYVYSDTDSVKYLGTHSWDELNARLRAEAEGAPIPAHIDIGGRRKHLGVWADEGAYKRFCHNGCKRYAYETDDGLHTVIAGLSKETGRAWLGAHGGLETFAQGDFTIPANESGRLASTYNDECIYIGGREITSNVALVASPYTFGISDEYGEFVQTAQKNNSIII